MEGILISSVTSNRTICDAISSYRLRSLRTSHKAWQLRFWGNWDQWCRTVQYGDIQRRDVVLLGIVFKKYFQVILFLISYWLIPMSSGHALMRFWSSIFNTLVASFNVCYCCAFLLQLTCTCTWCCRPVSFLCTSRQWKVMKWWGIISKGIDRIVRGLVAVPAHNDLNAITLISVTYSVIESVFSRLVGRFIFHGLSLPCVRLVILFIVVLSRREFIMKQYNILRWEQGSSVHQYIISNPVFV